MTLATESIALMGEVIKAEPGNYRDHLLIARAYDKLNRPDEAIEAYRRVQDLLAPAEVEDKQVKAEVERRLKVLDLQNVKVQSAEDEFLKKLDILEKEAIAARDMRALQRIFAARGGIWNARGRKEGFGVELCAPMEWYFDGFAHVQKGQKYHVRVAGTWTINGNRCTADGATAVPPTLNGVYGHLLAAVGDSGYVHLGTDTTFVAPGTGRVAFTANTKSQAERELSTGSVYILVQPIP